MAGFVDLASSWRGNLAELEVPVMRRLQGLESAGFLERFRAQDSSLWSPTAAGQAEARQRMGWVAAPERARARLADYATLPSEIRDAGCSHLLVLGMGGSSLACEVFGTVFARDPGTTGRMLGILDSTEPAQVAQAAVEFPPESTLYVVSSKSGGTSEVMAAFEYFWQLSRGNGARFIAISDEGTSLQTLARQRGFRRAFAADAAVGGRYSALTQFGLIPATLLGVDLDLLLERAERMQQACDDAQVVQGSNPGIALGALLGEAACAGRDKLTLVADPEIASLPNWVEQLVAESSGKDGKGIIPIALEPVDAPEVYGKDRLFVYLRQTGRMDDPIGALAESGFPVITLDVPEHYDVAGEFFRWEMAIATACHIIGVNPFDQPDVQESKNRTQAKVDELLAGGALEEGAWDIELGQGRDVSLGAARLLAFLSQAATGDYVAINAYLPRRTDVFCELQRLRVLVREHAGVATTVGFGPRFQHSTGQLHKGGPNSGLFVQIVAEPEIEVKIPGGAMTFGRLIRAQALADHETLVGRGRRTIRVHLEQPSDVATLRRAMYERSS